jgi:hypothetical protein
MSGNIKQYTDSELLDLLERINQEVGLRQKMTMEQLEIELQYCERQGWVKKPFMWLDVGPASKDLSIKFMLEWDDEKAGGEA